MLIAVLGFIGLPSSYNASSAGAAWNLTGAARVVSDTHWCFIRGQLFPMMKSILGLGRVCVEAYTGSLAGPALISSSVGVMTGVKSEEYIGWRFSNLPMYLPGFQGIYAKRGANQHASGAFSIVLQPS